MITQQKHFYSGPYRLSGSLFLPGQQADTPAHRPILIFCSGFTGICSLHPARFARFFTSFGYPCFGFDYRGFQASEGPEFRVILEEQAEDIRSAVSFVTALDVAKARPLLLAGWAMSAGLILRASFENPNVSALVALNGFYNGKRFLESHLGNEGLHEYEKRAAVWARDAASRDHERDQEVDPFLMYPMDPITTSHVDDSLRQHPGYLAEKYSTTFATSLLGWCPEIYASKLKMPLLIVHGKDNKLHQPAEAESLQRSYAGNVQMIWLDGAGHTEWMFDDHPAFRNLCNNLRDWIEQL